MQLAQVKSLTSVEPRATRFQPGFRRAERPEVQPECSSTSCVDVREVRSNRPRMTRIGADGEVPIVVCWDSSSAFICEFRGRPGVVDVLATRSSCSAAECGDGPAAPTAQVNTAVRIDPGDKDPF